MHGHVTERLGRQIASGSYPTGATLPNEQDLAEQLDISRGALREVVKALAAKGLIEPRPRSGTRVRPQEDWNLLDGELVRWMLESDTTTWVRQLNDVRRAIEPAIAARAAENSSTSSAAPLREAWESMVAAGSDVDKFQKADESFHRRLAEASGNVIFASLIRSLEPALHSAFGLTTDSLGPNSSVIAAHGAVLDAVEATDSSAASTAMAALIDVADAEFDRLSATDGPAATRRSRPRVSRR
jgi:DNA-binding FadR family transcriptional regulator